MSRQKQLMIGAGAVLVAVLALLAGNVIVREPDEPPNVVGFVILAAICVAAAGGIFLYLIPAAARAGGPANRLSQAAFVTSLVSLVLVIVYWTALPFVLGAGGAVLGRLGEERSRREMARAPRGEEDTDAKQLDGEDDEGEDDEDAGEEEDSPSIGERAGQGWIATIMGVLSFLACLLLFVVAPARPS